jgi:hypothetical protein
MNRFAGNGAVRPPLVGDPARAALALGPAHVDLPVARLALAAGGLELLDDVGVRYQSHEAVAQPRCHPGRCFARGGDEDRGWLVGKGVETGVLNRVVAPVVSGQAALPQLSNDLEVAAPDRVCSRKCPPPKRAWRPV